MDCAAYHGAETPDGNSDEESFSPDIYGDEDTPPPTGDKKKKTDDGFGDEDN
jgi:hypothetical protein